jgi:hypothetical protein
MATENTRPTEEKGVGKKGKKGDTFLKDYTGRLTDENLRFLDMRLKHRLQGDLADAVVMLSSTNDMDRYLSAAKGADDFYDMLDAIQKQVEREARRRHS